MIEVTETPTETPVESPDGVVVLEDTTKPAPFSEAQQKIFDAAIRSAQARAAKTLREDKERLELENQRLKEAAVGQHSDQELERIRGELASSRLEAAAAEARAIKQEKEVLQQKLGQQIGAVDPSSVAKLLSDSLVNRDGKWVVVDEATGVEKVNPDGTPQTPEQLYSEWSTKHLWAIKGNVLPGTGSTGSHGSQGPSS